MDLRKEATLRLQSCGIRPSVQRLAIMEYLLGHNSHPTVEEVYLALVDDIPTLSRTTVYNTLRMFSERGAAQMVTIDEHRVSYDGITRNHGHFYCRKCGRIFDIEMPSMQAPHLPEGSVIPEVGRVDDVQYYYKGICQDCATKEHKP